jgi:GT2 family glycosyltransferase
MPGVTAVVPNWNRRDLLLGLIGKLRAQTHPLDAILVIDNGSSDGSAEAARQAGARVIALKENAGFAAAVNRGIAETRTEWVAIVNNDVDPAADWLERLLEASGEPGVWFVTGKLLSPAGPWLDGAYDAICRGACPWRAGNGRPDGPLWAEPRRIRFASFTAALFRTALFRKAGGLDESFESYLEDVDFGLRCAARGLWGWYAPRAVATHLGSATLGAWHPDTVRRIARNQVLLVAKHYPLREFLRCGWSIGVAQALWGGLALRHGRGGAYLRGKFEGLCRFREVRRRAAAGDGFPAGLSKVLGESEREILTLQRSTGFDLYWRLYFALTSLT